MPGLMKINLIVIFQLLLIGSNIVFSQNIYNKIPGSIDSTKIYVFYIHGKIIEDQGINAVSEKYGAYEYKNILTALANKGLIVISEARPENTKSFDYANKIVAQIKILLNNSVPARNIVIIGASKGAGISVLISNFLKNENIKFVLMAICNDYMGNLWKKNNIQLWGDILYIFDYKDTLAESCKKYLELLRSKGMKNYKEIELRLGAGHGILYKPLKEWIEPIWIWINN